MPADHNPGTAEARIDAPGEQIPVDAPDAHEATASDGHGPPGRSQASPDTSTGTSQPAFSPSPGPSPGQPGPSGYTLPTGTGGPASGDPPQDHGKRRLHPVAIGAAVVVALLAAGLAWRTLMPPDPAEFDEISAGTSHSCGIRTDGGIECWGNDAQGQTESPDGEFTAIASGGRHSCALRTDGRIRCWGNESDGRVNPPAGRFTAISAGTSHSCGLHTDGGIECWGDDGDGRADPPDGEFTAVSAGMNYSCGIRTDDTAACWGANDQGQADPP